MVLIIMDEGDIDSEDDVLFASCVVSVLAPKTNIEKNVSNSVKRSNHTLHI